MKLSIISVGSLKSGPEKALVDDYVRRFRKTGRQIGLRDLTLVDVASGPDKAAEGERLLSKLPAGGRVMRLDEAGDALTSKAFADRIGVWRDQGTPTLSLLIGGADGFDGAVVDAHPDALALGPQTWPHRLVKVMLAEQLYRAATLLAGMPYHKA